MLTRLGEQTLIKLTQSNEQPDDMNVSVIQACCEDAQTEVESYCTARYSIPFDPVPKEIQRLCFSIARYYLYTYNRVDSFQISKERQDPVYLDYERALKKLESIKLGEYAILIEENEESRNSFENAIRIACGKIKFSEKNLESY